MSNLAQEDVNKNRIYLHEFYTEAEIIKGGTVKPGAVYDALTDSATFGKIILNPLYNINSLSMKYEVLKWGLLQVFI